MTLIPSKSLSVLVPYRAPAGSHRERLRRFTEQLWSQLPVEVVYADDGQDDGPFSVAAALNRARARASHDRLLVHGCDHIPPTPDRLWWIHEMLDRVPWTAVYETTRELTEDHTREVLDGAPIDETKSRVVPACQGIIAMHADVWDAVGGMDERFGAKWGYEDTAQRIALHALYPHGNPRGFGHVVTLWHPPRWETEGTGMDANRDLAAEYVQAAQEGRMAEYLAARRG